MPVAPCRHSTGYQAVTGAHSATVAACIAMGTATLSLVLERRAEEIHEPEFSAYAPLVKLEALLPLQRLFGWVRLDADRLTDLLNDHDLIRLTNVRVESPMGGGAVSVEEALVPRVKMIAVIASGPRGDPARRVETRPAAIVIASGAYRIGGLVHTLPGADPLQRLWHGDPMVPLTDAWVETRAGGQVRRERAGAIIINRHLMTGIELVSEPAG